MISTASLMESLPGRRGHGAASSPADRELLEAKADPWFGTVAIAAGLAVTPLLVVSALWMDFRKPLEMVGHTLPPGLVDTGSASRIRAAASAGQAPEPLERARLRLKAI